jgi:hypothetical protein
VTDEQPQQQLQLDALGQVAERLSENSFEYWVFGGWAVDLHAGRVTRAHDDIDISVWQHDFERIDALLTDDGWQRVPEPGEDGYTVYERGDVRLEVAFLARDDDGIVYTPAAAGRGEWPAGSFGADVGQLGAVRARVVSLAALRTDKLEAHGDARTAAKDQADVAVLSELLRDKRR